MSWRKYRVLILFIEIFVFFLIFLSFFKFFPGFFKNIPGRIQIIPLMISISGERAILSIFILIGFLILTIVFGRVYCSFLCPLGFSQDILMRFWKKIRKKRRFKYNPSFKKLRLLILVLVILSLISGSFYFVESLDPFSLFGKGVTYIFKPLLVLINNSADLLLRKLDIYSLSEMDYPKIHFMNLIPFILILGLIFLFTMEKGRLYCNTVCPLGTFLGLFSNRSVFGINIDNNSCTSCGLCEAVCKAGCIDSKNKRVDESSCIRCFNCLSVCPTNAINYVPFPWIEKRNARIEKKKGISRRRFISYLASLIGFTGLNFFFRRNNYLDSEIPPTPPGSRSLDRYLQKCTACYRCVNNCPTNVLQPSLFQYGIKGAFLPCMDFKSGFCEYECNICSTVCPTDALIPLTIDEKKEVQIGESYLRKDLCVVYSQNSDCGACAEICPTKAVHMVPYKALLVAPEIDSSLCVGCGACENVCPTEPRKAIVVKANMVHKKAEKSVPTIPEEKKKEIEGFPF
ncbi:MAG: 4Fe-4S binding protein [candidate division WOR-3 bacterium]|nr:4Fe-4S binding protein [candidate division WOR-3 bacterium]